MAHKPFNIYKSPTTKKKCFIYYVQFYGDDDRRMTARSAGQTSKARAENCAYEQLRKGLISTEKNISFGNFTEDFWIWGKCTYIKSRLSRKADISETYVDDMCTMLMKHILPYFENILMK